MAIAGMTSGAKSRKIRSTGAYYTRGVTKEDSRNVWKELGKNGWETTPLPEGPDKDLEPSK